MAYNTAGGAPTLLQHALGLIQSITSTTGGITTAMLTALLALASMSLGASEAAYSQDFQVFPPVLGLSPDGQVKLTDSFVEASVTQSGKRTCKEHLMSYTFGNSYGVPFVGPYSPPACDFNRVTWNMTVSVAGRQFDRLGTVYLGHVEVWRPTTAEPTAQGIYYTYLKVRHHLPFPFHIFPSIYSAANTSL